MEIKINQVEATRLNLQPDEVLLIKASGPDFMDDQVTASLQNALKQLFPFNQVMVLCLPEGHKLDFSVATVDLEPVPQASFCNDCNCGKKEAYKKTE